MMKIIHGPQSYQDNADIVTRIAFVLCNVTTNFPEACLELTLNNDAFRSLIVVGLDYLGQDEKEKESKPEPKTTQPRRPVMSNIEDAITKIVRLIANLATEEEVGFMKLVEVKDQCQQFIIELLKSIERRNDKDNEEYILNAISCLTNILFFDSPTQDLL
jgi:hypothetical protein